MDTTTAFPISPITNIIIKTAWNAYNNQNSMERVVSRFFCSWKI